MIYLSALFVFGPIAGMLMASVRAVDGGVAATPLVSASPMAGVLAALGAVAIALVVGAVAARLLGLAPGMTAAGLIMAWAAWRSGTIEGLVRAEQSGAPLRSLAIEGLLFGVIGVILAAALAMISRHDGYGHSGHRAEGGGLRLVLPGKAVLPALGVGLLAGAVVAWFLAVSPLKGQAVLSAVCAAVAMAAAARLVDLRTPMAGLAIPVAALAVLGPLAGLALAGNGGSVSGVVASVYRGTLAPIANITPLDWIAGGLLGIPMGVAWAGSMMEKGHAAA